MRARVGRPTNAKMRAEPQAARYRPDPQILALAEWLGDVVTPAEFPKAELRFRNRRWDCAVGLGELPDAA